MAQDSTNWHIHLSFFLKTVKFSTDVVGIVGDWIGVCRAATDDEEMNSIKMGLHRGGGFVNGRTKKNMIITHA